jgi:penicillin-binding protein 2
MKHMRITTAHQSITFSRRMMLLGGAQAAVGGLLIGRMGWLAIAQNEKYNLLSESNRVQLIPVPPRRGWIIDRNGKPIAINKASFRVDLIPQQIVDGPKIIAELQRLMNLPPRRGGANYTRIVAIAGIPTGLGRRQCSL